MPRRGSYLSSIDNPPPLLQISHGNYLKPPSVNYGGDTGDGSTRNGSVSSKTGSKAGSRSGSVVSKSGSGDSDKTFSDYYGEKVASKTSLEIEEEMKKGNQIVHFYMTALGLNMSYTRTTPLAKLNAAYCYSVTALLFISSLRRFQQVGTREPGLPPLPWGQAIFDPTIVITLCNAIFIMTGAFSSMMLILMSRKMRDFNESFGATLKRFRDHTDEAKQLRANKIMVAICVGLSLSSVASTLCYKIKALRLPWLPAFITDHWYFWPLEVYLSFIAQNAICILTISFATTCTMLRYSIQNLLKNMVPEGDHEDCPLPEESLRRIRDVQIQHQEILSAKTLMEENFSFVLFYSYGCAIPAICFLGYLILKNISSNDDNWALHLSLGMWIFTTMSALMIMSIPAFMIHEDGEKLLSASFKMYHEALCEERDLLVVSQMTLLVFQIHSAKLTLSASNYFSMNRKILISLFSAIFTYFLILVQFGESTAKNFEDNSTMI